MVTFAALLSTEPSPDLVSGLFLGYPIDNDDKQDHYQYTDHRPDQHSTATHPTTHPSECMVHHKTPVCIMIHESPLFCTATKPTTRQECEPWQHGNLSRRLLYLLLPTLTQKRSGLFKDCPIVSPRSPQALHGRPFPRLHPYLQNHLLLSLLRFALLPEVCVHTFGRRLFCSCFRQSTCNE